MPRPDHNSGFTLIELVLALAIGAMVLLTARALFGEVLDGELRTENAARRTADEYQGRRALSLALASIDITSEGVAQFRGEPHRLTCSAWLRRPGGGLGLSEVRIEDQGRALLLGGEVMLQDVDSLSIDYLLVPGARSVWTPAWRSSVAVPVALRLRLLRPGRTDTLLIAVGERG